MGTRSKLEPTLGALVDPTIAHTAPAGDILHVLVKFTGPVDDLTAAGFEPWTALTHPTDGYSIAAGPIPWRRLDELAAVPHVLFIEASRTGQHELNHSVAEIHADVLHSANPAHLGAGAVIGIIDTGADFTHHSFGNSDGSSRVDVEPPVGGWKGRGRQHERRDPTAPPAAAHPAGPTTALRRPEPELEHCRRRRPRDRGSRPLHHGCVLFCRDDSPAGVSAE